MQKKNGGSIFGYFEGREAARGVSVFGWFVGVRR